MDRFYDIHHKLTANGMVVPFDPEWHNGTGYFNRAVAAEVGRLPVAASQDEKGRKIILVATAVGNVVFFQRYRPEDGAENTGTVCYNAAGLNALLMPEGNAGAVNNDAQWRWLPSRGDNGEWFGGIRCHVQDVLAEARKVI